jgi:hypothetical protein
MDDNFLKYGSSINIFIGFKNMKIILNEEIAF